MNLLYYKVDDLKTAMLLYCVYMQSNVRSAGEWITMKKVLLIMLAVVILIAGCIGAVFAIYNRFAIDPDTVLDDSAAAVTQTPEPTAEPTPTPEPTPEPTPKPEWPDIDISQWQYMLVNADSDISTYAPPELEYVEGCPLDSRITEAMKQFVAAAKAEGLNIYLSSGYRSYYDQQYLYQRKVAQYGAATAKTIVAPPGTSEHQTGLCCDITDQYYEFKTTDLENTALYQWMSQHCHEYGFIVRYPKDKQDITGIIYEPWHFRYVGIEAATYIMEKGLCLEEFVALYQNVG